MKYSIFKSLSLTTCKLLVVLFFSTACQNKKEINTISSTSDLHFNQLSQTWDEGIPLGNATVGALIWQRDSALRLSLDRIDLWDLRPIENFSSPEFSFAWIKKQLDQNTYSEVHTKFDKLYDQIAAPSKIPGAALEFSLKDLGKPFDVHLYLNNALCEVRWKNDVSLKTFVHATKPLGWFVFENVPDSIHPTLLPPLYENNTNTNGGNSLEGISLGRLGYKQGTVNELTQEISYHQLGWNGFYYDVNVRWERQDNELYGVWSITSSISEEKADDLTASALKRGVSSDYQDHLTYWDRYWSASSVSIPDPILQKQYDNEMYKFGSVARENSYPISLQAVWTADDGNLPPWKGDFHHDLNTQLSYWPAYTGNHLSEGLGYLNTLWNQRDAYRKYTKKFFNCEGLNVPGVCTLTGDIMGGWSQYTMSSTVSAWLAQHFYLHWKYSKDRDFLEKRAYPFLKEVAVFLEQFTVINSDGLRTLPLSSSPEIYNNSPQAWFKTITNYDLSLIRFVFGATVELARELKLEDEAEHWHEILQQLPDFDLDNENALTFAKGFPYNESHRHFSHAMAIYPLGLIDFSQGEKSQQVIRATIDKLKEFGPDYWCGYSYSWFANLNARAFDGEAAAEALRTFAECFCLPNTFHVNGDQTGTGKSKFTYRPFTLEGNFAFAAGVQEMLLQSHTGIIHVFPAIPKSWKNVSFNNLRAMGAFLVSAVQKNGIVNKIEIYPENTGVCKIKLLDNTNPDKVQITGNQGEIICNNNILTIPVQKGQKVIISIGTQPNDQKIIN